MTKKVIDKGKQKLIYLQWVDAHSTEGWLTCEQVEHKIEQEACVVEQVGWILFEDKKELHLASRRLGWDKKYCPESISEYGHYQRIPKTWVLKRKEIKV